MSHVLPEASRLEAALGHRFQDQRLLQAALQHPSAQEALEAEELTPGRLAFLGDAVWGLLVSHHLFLQLNRAPQGELAALKAHLTSTLFLAELAQTLDLPRSLRLGKGEEKAGGRKKASILASAMEAVLAALYLDGGFEAAFRFVKRHLDAALSGKAKAVTDPKSSLQVLAQALFKRLPLYRVTGKGGPPHEPWYEVEVSIEGSVAGRGKGRSKKEAEQAAAQEALAAFESLKCNI